MTTPSLGYLAGMVDGEGCINISRRMARGGVRPSYRLELVISNNHRPMLEALATTYGGSVHAVRPGHFQLRFGAAATFAVLTNCLPYLLIKGRQARIALDFYETFDRPLTDALVTLREEMKKALMERPLG